MVLDGGRTLLVVPVLTSLSLKPVSLLRLGTSRGDDSDIASSYEAHSSGELGAAL